MNSQNINVLGPGKVYIDYGPVSMVVQASRAAIPMTELCSTAITVVEKALQEITAALPLLRLPPGQIPAHTLNGLPLKMLQAVQAVEEPTLTPMATVAGAIADTVADWLAAQGATRVIVNNGGDIALRLAPGESVRLGILSSLDKGEIDTIVPITAADGIGGVATSGLGGRSLTRGIANAVSIFADRCIYADALATHLANQTFIDGPQVQTAKAGSIDPLSDIAQLDVVTAVGKLTKAQVDLALANLEQAAQTQFDKQLFWGLRANVQNHFISFPVNFFVNITKGDEKYGA